MFIEEKSTTTKRIFTSLSSDQNRGYLIEVDASNSKEDLANGLPEGGIVWYFDHDDDFDREAYAEFVKGLHHIMGSSTFKKRVKEKFDVVWNRAE